MRRLRVNGDRAGMVSAEMEKNGIKFVLCQGTEPGSLVSRLIASRGAGIAHIALTVESADIASKSLAQRGLKFHTSVIAGAGLKQVFARRDDRKRRKRPAVPPSIGV